jgi:hypothetical protein
VGDEQPDGSVAHDQDPGTGLKVDLVEATQGYSRWLGQRGGIESDTVIEPMDEVLENRHCGAGSAVSRETKLFVRAAEVGVATAALGADRTGNDSLDDNAISRFDAGDVFTDGCDNAGPLVPEDDRVANVGRIQSPVDDLEVRAAEPDVVWGDSDEQAMRFLGVPRLESNFPRRVSNQGKIRRRLDGSGGNSGHGRIHAFSWALGRELWAAPPTAIVI